VQLTYRKAGHRGLAKNQAQFHALFELGNLFPAQRRLIA
jgi:hypothetical protein